MPNFDADLRFLRSEVQNLIIFSAHKFNNSQELREYSAHHHLQYIILMLLMSRVHLHHLHILKVSFGKYVDELYAKPLYYVCMAAEFSRIVKLTKHHHHGATAQK